MKTVFSNRQCAHIWAQLSQPFGRSGSMRFDGAVAYSYREPVAHLIRPHGATLPVALFRSEKFSVTTAHHVSLYRRAVRGGILAFTVPHIFAHDAPRVRDAQSTADDHAENLAYFLGEYEKEYSALMRCPADSYRLAGSNLAETLIALARRCETYCDAFRIPAPAWCHPTYSRVPADVARIEARRDRLLNDPKRAAKREAAAAARERAAERKAEALREAQRLERLENAAKVEAWRAGEDVRLPYRAQVDEHGAAMLRIRGDIVETSLGAEAPLAHVRRALGFYRATVSANALPWERTDSAHGDSMTRLGHFTLDSIAEDGSVRAGCHYISAAEIERLAASL